MVNQIQVFNNPQFGDIRTAGTADNPLFCLKDVCNAIDITNQRNVTSRLDTEDVQLVDTPTNGGCQPMTYVSEGGLYDAIVRSDSPKARPFRKWVTHEVLPTIRKTGGYIATAQKDTPELIMARALQVAQATIDKHQQMLEQANERIVLQSEQLKQQAPKVKSYDEYISSDGTFSATQIAKEYGWGAKTLNNKLREMGVQYKQHGQWLLFAKYSGKGYTKSVPHAFTHADGRVDVRMSTVWTAKGREYIHSLLNAGQPGMLNFKDGGNK